MRISSSRHVMPFDLKTATLTTFILPVVIGAVLGFMILTLGVMAPAIVIGIIALPWFVREPFRLYLWLIITWSPLGLYLRLALPGGMPDLSYERILIPVTMALVVMPALALKKRLPPLSLWVSLYLVIQLISYGSAALSDNVVPPNLVIFLDAVLLPLMMYWLTKAFITSRWRLQWLLYALIIATMIICLTGLYERILNLQQSPFPLKTGTASGLRYLDVPGGRAAGVSGNPAIYGAKLGTGLLAGLCCFAHAQRKRAKFILGAAVVILTYGVMVSFTRSAWLGVLGAILVAQFFIKSLWKGTVSIFLVGVVATMLIALVATDQIMNNQVVQERVLEQHNVTGRVDRVAFGWDQFFEKPWFGWGPGALDFFTGQHFREGGFNVSHNTFLTFLVDGGVVTFCSFSGVILFWLFQALQIILRSQTGSFERSVLGVMIGTLVIYLLSGLALELKFFGFYNGLFWVAGATIECLRGMLANQNRETMGLNGIKGQYAH